MHPANPIRPSSEAEPEPGPARSRPELQPVTESPWDPLLESLVRCPECGAPDVALEEFLYCRRCTWRGQRTAEGIADFVDNNKQQAQHLAELEAQSHAVDEYYENSDRLTCHWDRISADELPRLLGWPGGVALDLGCGTGTAGGSLRRSGTKVVGADLVPACLAAARKRLDAVVRVDAAHLPFRDEAFDALVMRGALHHFSEPETALAEAHRVLKPNAPAVFADPRHFAWLEPIKHALRAGDDSFTDDHRAYTPNDYRALIEEYFEIDEVSTTYPLGILVAHGLDLLPMPRAVPRRWIASGLYQLDRFLDRTPARHGGHLLVVSGRRR